MKQVNVQKSKVKKVIIPAAGWGTRFLPMTKIIPKELVPILNRPSIDLLVDEAINSGIEEIILVISTRKQEIMKYFQPNIPLEEELKSKNKWELLKHVKKTNRDAIIRVVYQYEQLGLAHAILTGARFFKNEPFAVILGDDLIKSKIPVIKQMMNESNKIKVQVLEKVIVQMNLDIEAMNHRIHYAEKLIHELKENDDETIEWSNKKNTDNRIDCSFYCWRIIYRNKNW